MGKEKRNMYDPFMKRIIWRKTNCINVLKNYYIHKKKEKQSLKFFIIITTLT